MKNESKPRFTQMCAFFTRLFTCVVLFPCSVLQARLNLDPSDANVATADGELEVPFTIIIPRSLVTNKTRGRVDKEAWEE